MATTLSSTYILASVRVVEEAVFGGRAVGQVHAELELEGLAEHVRARVPESLFAFLVRELEKFELAVTFQWARRVVKHPPVATAACFFLWVCQVAVESGNPSIDVPDFGDDDFLCQLA